MEFLGMHGTSTSCCQPGTPGHARGSSPFVFSGGKTMSVKELWERVQEMFTPAYQTSFDQWLRSQNPSDAADLERLEREWYRIQQFRQVF